MITPTATQDALTRAATAFDGWAQLLAAHDQGYRPSLRRDRPQHAALGVELEFQGRDVFWG